MIATKAVTLLKTIIPETQVRIEDPFSNIMIQVLKLINLYKSISIQELINILGFSEELIQLIISKLDHNISINGENISLSEEGHSTMESAKVQKIEISPIRLLVTKSPHFVLSHFFSVYSYDDVVADDELLRLINQKKDISGLNPAVQKLGPNVYVISQIAAKANYNLDNDKLWIIEVNSSYRKQRKYDVTISENDGELLHEIDTIKDMVDQDSETLISIYFSKFFKEKTDNFVQVDKNQVYITDDINNQSLENIYSWLNTVRYSSDHNMKMSIDLIESWSTELNVKVVTDSEFMMEILFSFYIQENLISNRLLDSIDFSFDLGLVWTEFLQNHEFIYFDYTTAQLFDALWQHDKVISKMLASRLTESELFA